MAIFFQKGLISEESKIYHHLRKLFDFMMDEGISVVEPSNRYCELIGQSNEIEILLSDRLKGDDLKLFRKFVDYQLEMALYENFYYYIDGIYYADEVTALYPEINEIRNQRKHNAFSDYKMPDENSSS